MGRVGFVWCSVVTIFALFVELLTHDLSQPSADLLGLRILVGLEPKALAALIGLLALLSLVLLSAAILRSAWNRIAPHVLQGARAMTFAEAYAVSLIFGFVS